MPGLQTHSGPLVATTFHRLLAAVYLLAWLSLLWQVDVLIGSRGLLPFADLVDPEKIRFQLEYARFPSIFLWNASDTALHAGIWFGIALSLLWLAGSTPRVCAIVSAILYLSYAVAARDFLHFQWDNMLVECGVLAALLPVDRAARWAHLLFRVLLFKLYFESGIAKWQSYLGDWHDGSAMTFYYETAPLPTWLGWYAHNLPQWWHELESRLVLVLELVVPFAIFGPRRARLVSAAAFTLFQLVNIATANYGFFCYLSLALHVFLLDDTDLAGIARRQASPAIARPAPIRAARRIGAALIVTLYIAMSAVEAAYAFAPPFQAPDQLSSLRRAYMPFRIVNTYHLFGHITRERVEPEIEIFDGDRWRSLDLRHKPGDPLRRPAFVAPHQPRVDFRLWFYGLSYSRGTPRYVEALVHRICTDPETVADLFAEPLGHPPQSVRLAFWQYVFTESPDDEAWWRRRRVNETRPIRCDAVRPPRVKR